MRACMRVCAWRTKKGKRKENKKKLINERMQWCKNALKTSINTKWLRMTINEKPLWNCKMIKWWKQSECFQLKEGKNGIERQKTFFSSGCILDCILHYIFIEKSINVCDDSILTFHKMLHWLLMTQAYSWHFSPFILYHKHPT